MQRQRKEYIPVDTSGTTMKSRTFFDFIARKTINYDIGKGYTFSVMHIGAVDASMEMENFIACFKALQTAVETKQKILRYQQVKTVYEALVASFYRLSKNFYPWWRRWHYRAALRAFCFGNIDNVLSMGEALVNYWVPVKKKISLLAGGQTALQIYGVGFTWSNWQREEEQKKLRKSLCMSFLKRSPTKPKKPN